jgi:hypothetical protein
VACFLVFRPPLPLRPQQANFSIFSTLFFNSLPLYGQTLRIRTWQVGKYFFL